MTILKPTSTLLRKKAFYLTLKNTGTKFASYTMLALCLGGTMLVQTATAHESEHEVTQQGMGTYFAKLDASTGMPKGVSKEYIANSIKKSGGTSADTEFVLNTFKRDICSYGEMASFCKYAGRETVYKVRNLAWQAKLDGASNQEIMDIVSPVLDYGTAKNLESLYGKRGMKADESSRRDRRRLKDGKQVPQRRDLRKRVIPDRLKCFGLRTDVDTQTIPTTNPLYARKYRLVTCGLGMNKRWAYSIWGFEFSAQIGLVGTHSRMGRRVLGFYHLTGADAHICATADVLGNNQTNCNSNNWRAPWTWRFGAIAMQPPGTVAARGHAHKLGHNFNTQINF